MGKYERKRRSNWKRKVLSSLCVVLSLILAVMVAGTVYYESLLNKINRPGDTETLSHEEIQQFLEEDVAEATGTGPTVHEDEVILEDQPAEVITKTESVNIMLVGQDARPGEKRARSDAMILCTIRKSDNTVIMTSFLRDSYVNIPGIRKGKLNTAYIYGGMDLLSDTILENFGVEIDNTVEVNFNGFMEIIDTMGGVDITLTKDEANYLNSRGNWGVFNERDWHLTEGVNTLNGSQALAYSRIRSIGTDFGRTERQRTVLQALIEKVRDLNLTELNNLVNSLVGLITTDMTNAEITGYVLEFFPMLKDLKIVTQRIPQNDTYHFSVISGVGDSIIMDFEKNRAFLRETLGD